MVLLVSICDPRLVVCHPSQYWEPLLLLKPGLLIRSQPENLSGPDVVRGYWQVDDEAPRKEDIPKPAPVNNVWDEDVGEGCSRVAYVNGLLETAQQLADQPVDSRRIEVFNSVTVLVNRD